MCFPPAGSLPASLVVILTMVASFERRWWPQQGVPRQDHPECMSLACTPGCLRGLIPVVQAPCSMQWREQGLEIVTGFQIEALLLPACVSSSTFLSLTSFSAENGNGIHDRIETQGVMIWPSFPPILCVHFPQVILSKSSWALPLS